MKKKMLILALSIIAAVAIAATSIIALSPEAVIPNVISVFDGENVDGGTVGPSLRDSALSLEEVAGRMQYPTSMAFLDANKILVLQKNDGQVRLVSDDQLYERPVLQIDDVANQAEQGLVGIAVWNGSSATSNEVFLYVTQNVTDNDGGVGVGENTTIAKNRIYRYNYDLDQKSLVNGTLIMEIPGTPGPYHNGGKITIGPDGYLYAVIGDLTDSWSVLDNEADGGIPADHLRSVVVRIDRETGEAPKDNPFYGIYNDTALDKVYAYGVRNSFGLDFDPITNILWITENGPENPCYDEINIVTPGFNSGWDKFSGPIAKSNMTIDKDLVMFKGAHYSDPVFSWYHCVGVTDIKFFNSDKLGEKYKDNIFTADVNHGNLYYFTVNDSRNGLVLEGNLSDLMADNDEETSSLAIGTGFAAITDIETGPDGYLYLLTYLDGKIYRITPSAEEGQQGV